MELIELKANVRTGRGKGTARRLRVDGKLPVVLYGPGSEAMALSIDIADLEKAFKNRSGSQVFFNLVIDDEAIGNKAAMIKELQTHPVSRDFIHADFYEIAMDRKIIAMAPVTITGKSIGVEEGGMVQIIRRELEVLCYPNKMPQEIVIDITGMNMGDSIHIEDIPVEEGTEFPHDVNFTVLTILSARAIEEEEVDEEEELDEDAEGEEEAAEEE